jgi:hypothetical protein
MASDVDFTNEVEEVYWFSDAFHVVLSGSNLDAGTQMCSTILLPNGKENIYCFIVIKQIKIQNIT